MRISHLRAGRPLSLSPAMANRTDPLAQTVHGTNPQNLVSGDTAQLACAVRLEPSRLMLMHPSLCPRVQVEKILRLRIYEARYWKEECFALTAETLVDKAMELDHVGGVFGSSRKPTRFICLALKMLQLQPEKDIVVEFIKNEDFKCVPCSRHALWRCGTHSQRILGAHHLRYVRALGAFYMRLVGRANDIYDYLEPLYNDYRKLRKKSANGELPPLPLPPPFVRLLTHDRGRLGGHAHGRICGRVAAGGYVLRNRHASAAATRAAGGAGRAGPAAERAGRRAGAGAAGGAGPSRTAAVAAVGAAGAGAVGGAAGSGGGAKRAERWC